MTDTPRQIALEILNRVEKEEVHADLLLSKYFKRRTDLSSREKALITELVYGIIRWRGSIDWVIEQFSTYPNRRISRSVRNILRIGIYQILYLSNIPISKAVYTTVDLAKSLTDEKIASMVNGILRNVDRSRAKIKYPSLQEDPVKAIVVQYSHPVWLVERWLHQYGINETISLCKANNTPPPFTIRTNSLKISRKELIKNLLKEGVECEPTPHSPEGIILHQPADVTRFSSFQKGWFMVQDEAAQMISYLLAPKPGEKILDLCAAPGGKTTHLAQFMKNQGCIFAVDIRQDKIAHLKENQSRLGIEIIRTILADATQKLPLKNNKEFDKILLDVPCSGLGILRRHPEGKWVKSSRTISRLEKIQSDIIQNASRYVKPGGIMVYSTCTFNPEENENVVDKFLYGARNKFQLENPRQNLPSQVEKFIDNRGYFRTFPSRDNMDGFFAACLRRIS